MTLSIEVSRNDGIAEVRVSGELDLATAPDLSEVLDPLAASEQRVVVDLAGLTFMDSSGLAALLAAHKVLADGGGVLELRSPQPAIIRLVHTVGLEDVFEVRLG
jgi:anti-sigma B factor antagonist